MKRFFRNNSFVFLAFLVWRIVLGLIEAGSRGWWPLKSAYLGPIPWANFDGVHYLGIATGGYGQYQQAFFPLYPLLIRWLTVINGVTPWIAGLIISHIAFLFGLLFFYHWARKLGENTARWAVIFLLAYPASFFFAAVYNESLYFLLATSVFWYLSQRQGILVGFFGMLSSCTRLFGILLWPPVLWSVHSKKSSQSSGMKLAALLVPLGLLAYMGYLWVITGDPLAFYHVQPEFGASRTSSTVVFPLQVLWRYGKILATASKHTLSYWVASSELTIFIIGLILVGWGWRLWALRLALLYSLMVLLVPSLTGTLSSMPRYLLSAFPLFVVLGSMDNIWIKYAILAVFSFGLVAAISLFLQGYFVS